MPKITNLRIDNHVVTYRGEPLWPEPVEYRGDPIRSMYKVTVHTDLVFRPIELQLEMEYVARIALYEIDAGLDDASVHLNWNNIHVQRISHGPEDDHTGFSPPYHITADEPSQPLQHTFFVVPRPEADKQFEFRALVTCTPAVGPAVAWSDMETLPERKPTDP